MPLSLGFSVHNVTAAEVEPDQELEEFQSGGPEVTGTMDLQGPDCTDTGVQTAGEFSFLLLVLNSTKACVESAWR